MYSLLQDPFIRVTLTGCEPRLMTLPEIYAAFLKDEVESFPGLRPHQRAGWHMLLAQLGAIATYRYGTSLKTAKAWREALTRIAPAPAWDLIGEEDAAPAFLQPPMSAPYREGRRIRAADMLDILVTARNHAIKAGQATSAGPDSWLFALVTLQTMQGFSGNLLYGISRMNKGLGNRPFVGLAPSGGIGAHVMRDIRMMIAAREGVLKRTGLSEEGHDLLWTQPWDGSKALRFASLAPWYVEICRRVRLRRDVIGIFADTETSTCPRVDAEGLNGLTGDHWAPTVLKEQKLYTADGRGLNANVACDLLFPQDGVRRYETSDALRLLPGEKDMRVVMRVLVRGQGKTEGYHEREIPFRRAALSLLQTEAGTLRLADMAREHLAELAEISSAIRYGMIGFCAGGDRTAMQKPSKELAAQADHLSAKLRAAFLKGADPAFFDRVQDRLETPGAEIGQLQGLIGEARALFLPTLLSLPVSSPRRLKAQIAGERAFEVAVRFGRGRIGSLRDQIFPPRVTQDEKETA